MPDGTTVAPAPAATPDATQTQNASPAPSPAPDTATVTAAPDAGVVDTTAAAPSNGGTVLDSIKSDDQVKEAPANWPENWREIMAGGNAKALQKLNRYASPANVWKALEATGAKISSGDLLKAKPDGSDEAALNEWRAQIGIPEKPEGYLAKVPDGLVIGEDDKAQVDDFLKTMHAKDMPPAHVHEALLWYNQVKEQTAQRRAEADRGNRVRMEDELRSEWGPDYRGNVNGIISLLSTHGGEDLVESLMTARLSDGTLVGAHTPTLKALAQLDKMVNPHGTLPSPESAQGRSMTSRKDEIMKAMKDGNSDYYRGPKGASGETKMAEEYRQIIEWEQKRGAR